MKKKEQTQHMIFEENKFYTDLENPLYLKGKVYEVEERMVGRWLKRGGVLVDSQGVDDKGFDWKKLLNPKKAKEVVEEKVEPVVEALPVTPEVIPQEEVVEEIKEEDEVKEKKHHGHYNKHGNKHK